MKKIKFIAMAMLALLTAQCKKNEPEPEPKVMVPISGSVSFGGGSKTEITTTGYVTPKSGDKIYIYHAGDYVGSLTCTPDTEQAFTCSGEIEKSCLGEACTFMYLGSGSTDDEGKPIDGTSSTISFANQTGINVNSGKISGIDKFHVGSCKANVSNEGIVSLPMRTKISIAYFQLKDQNGSAMADKNITISGVSATATIKKTDGTLEGVRGDGTGTIRVHTDENGCFYMALVPQSDAATFTFTSANANGTDVFPYGIGECCFYSEQGNVSKPLPVQMNSIVTPDLLPGKFSVSATEYVQFSRGNLYCTDNGSSESPRYSFDLESEQYNFHTRYGLTHYSNSGSSEIADPSSVPGIIYEANASGFFQWVSENAAGKTDEAVASYGAFSSLTYEQCTGQLTDEVDYGRAYGDGTSWSTLTSDEMQYLLNNHTTKWSTVCGVTGLVLAPDEWTGSIADSYDVSSWLAAESSGLVFLPAAGYFNKDFSAVYSCTSYGDYWSKTPGSGYAYDAYYMYFCSNEASTYSNKRSSGLSVRLVQRQAWPDVQPDFIDLDLPSGLLWATCNVGADSPEGYGWYFMWGSVTEGGDPNCSWANCPGNEGSSAYDETALKTWNAANLTNNVLNPDVDAATANWGGGWRMPTSAEWTELIGNTESEWTTENGVYGRKFTSKKDSSKYIFMPASGYGDGSSVTHKGTAGHYWSSTHVSGSPNASRGVRFFADGRLFDPDPINRFYGYTVRPVRDAR